MKLVIATPLYPPEIGGPATYVKILEEGLPTHNIDVEVVKFSDVRHLPKIIRHYAYYRRVLKAARHADAVLALDPVSVGLPAMCAAKKAGKPFVVKIVGDYAWEQGQQRFGISQTLDEFVKTSRTPFPVHALRWIQSRVARSAVQIIVPSEYLKGLVTVWGIPTDKIQVIYNAVLTDSIGMVPEAMNKLPQPLVVSVGRLVPWKGMDRLIDGIWSARREESNASLVIVGDGPERTNLEQYATKMLKENYLFTGELSHADALAVIQKADIFVLNSSYEGLSHVLIEALKLGSSIITTNAGGNSEVIMKGDGIIINVGDERFLASSLKSLIDHKEERVRLSIAARKSGQRFSPTVMLNATAVFLKSFV